MADHPPAHVLDALQRTLEHSVRQLQEAVNLLFPELRHEWSRENMVSHIWVVTQFLETLVPLEKLILEVRDLVRDEHRNPDGEVRHAEIIAQLAQDVRRPPDNPINQDQREVINEQFFEELYRIVYPPDVRGPNRHLSERTLASYAHLIYEKVLQFRIQVPTEIDRERIQCLLCFLLYDFDSLVNFRDPNLIFVPPVGGGPMPAAAPPMPRNGFERRAHVRDLIARIFPLVGAGPVLPAAPPMLPAAPPMPAAAPPMVPAAGPMPAAAGPMPAAAPPMPQRRLAHIEDVIAFLLPRIGAGPIDGAAVLAEARRIDRERELQLRLHQAGADAMPAAAPPMLPAAGRALLPPGPMLRVSGPIPAAAPMPAAEGPMPAAAAAAPMLHVNARDLNAQNFPRMLAAVARMNPAEGPMFVGAGRMNGAAILAEARLVDREHELQLRRHQADAGAMPAAAPPVLPAAGRPLFAPGSMIRVSGPIPAAVAPIFAVEGRMPAAVPPMLPAAGRAVPAAEQMPAAAAPMLRNAFDRLVNVRDARAQIPPPVGAAPMFAVAPLIRQHEFDRIVNGQGPNAQVFPPLGGGPMLPAAGPIRHAAPMPAAAPPMFPAARMPAVAAPILRDHRRVDRDRELLRRRHQDAESPPAVGEHRRQRHPHRHRRRMERPRRPVLRLFRNERPWQEEIPPPNGKIDYMQWNSLETGQWAQTMMGGFKGLEMFMEIFEKKYDGIIIDQFLSRSQEMANEFRLTRTEKMKAKAFAAAVVNRQIRARYAEEKREYRRKMIEYHRQNLRAR